MWNISDPLFPSPENWTRWKVGPRSEEDHFFFETLDVDYWYTFQINWWWIFWVFTAVYWIVTYSLQRFMKNREPLEGLDGLMVVYNGLVALFSIFALCRGCTTFLPVLSGPDGFYKSLCVRFPVTERDAFWLIAGAWSKLVHFLDTVFSVLRKRPVQFMQMYHHSVVVLVPQHILPYGEPILYWWGLANMVQHSILYSYFVFKAMKVKVPRMVATLIVVVEVVQMFVGLGTGVYTLYVLRNGGECVRHPKSISIMYFVYATMAILALRMAFDHFRRKTPEQGNNKKIKSS